MEQLPSGGRRALTPFEHRVLGMVCEGKTNAKIARLTSLSEKAVENTISRTARVFGIKRSDGINPRVLLALAYRGSYGDAGLLASCCSEMEVRDGGARSCTRHRGATDLLESEGPKGSTLTGSMNDVKRITSN